jgi:hypothetical protein
MEADGPIAMIVSGQLAQHSCQLRVLGIIKVRKIRPRLACHHRCGQWQLFYGSWSRGDLRRLNFDARSDLRFLDARPINHTLTRRSVQR